jgi:hypothetical protein
VVVTWSARRSTPSPRSAPADYGHGQSQWDAVGAAGGVNHFMLAVTGLHEDDTSTASVLYLPQRRGRALQAHRRDPGCSRSSTGGILERGNAISEEAPRMFETSSKAHEGNSPH